MANWMQQLREAYKALQEAELLKGREAAARQAQLAAQGKPLAVQAVRRVERIGGFEPPNETEDITARVARQLLNAPHPTGTSPFDMPVQGPKRAIRGSKQERKEMAGLEQAKKMVDELAAERAARLKAAKENITEAELVKGKEAAARQAQLAAQGKPLAVQAVRRVEKLPMSSSQIPSRRGNSRIVPSGDRAVREPFDVENLGFADAQIRPNPRGRRSGEMEGDDTITKSQVVGWHGTLVDAPVGSTSKTPLSPIEQEVRDAKKRVRHGLPKIINRK